MQLDTREMIGTTVYREAAEIARHLTGIGLTIAKAMAFIYLPVVVALTLLHFPYDTDTPDTSASASTRRSFMKLRIAGPPSDIGG
jgi:hypothetical protein